MGKPTNVRLIYKDSVLIAKISGEIDHHTAADIREEIDETSQKLKPCCLRLDFSEVPFMDSSGIGLILGRVKLYKFWNGHVVITGLSRSVSRMVELSGVGAVAEIIKEAV